MPRPPHSSSDKPSRAGRKPNTSWDQSAEWYDRILGAQGSEIYQRVVIPGALHMLNPKPEEQMLDLGCGQGVFSRALADEGCKVTGVDLSPSLIEKAKNYRSRKPVRYVCRDAADIGDLGLFDAVSAILSLQNMPHLEEVCRACAGVLKKGGRMLWVMNHPCFRIPRQTSWGWDDEQMIQYRRVDAYGSPTTVPILMHPGQPESESTTSFHHSLTDLLRAAFDAGFVLNALEEGYSDKQSEPGPRAHAENKARNEFPLFIALLWNKP